MSRPTALAVLMGLSLTCSGGDEPDGGGLVHLDGSAPPPDASSSAPTYTVYSIPDCGAAGYQTVAAAADGRVAFATLATTGQTAPCELVDRTSSGSVYNICVVLPSATGFAGSIVTSQTYSAPTMGVGIAFDTAGVPVLAYTGGLSGDYRCGASDMMIANISGGQLGTQRTIASDSQSTGMPADQAVSCAAQDVCNQGDATGYWPSIARDPVSGAMAVAFRDLHFGFANDDLSASSDVEFAKGDAYAVYTVDVARGGGTYNRLAFSPAGKAAVAHYDLHQPAIWLDLETAQGWTSQRLVTGEIREPLAFTISAQGLYALAYFDVKRRLLVYRESLDGVTWTAGENVDPEGLTGYFPSLAFDAQGEPAIAYYRCADSTTSSTCDANKDGLYLARRRQGNFQKHKVRGEDDIFDGLYTALAFVDGKAVIAYQSSYFDPVSTTSKVSLSIAKEM